MELTFGSPNANGFGQVKEGLLNNNISDDLLVTILEDHIQLALKYTENDLKFIESGELLDMHFNDVAVARVQHGKKWLSTL